MFSVTEHCAECGGDSVGIIGHPNDPSARLVECGWCYNGTATREVDGYATVDEVREDYPNAIAITETANG